MHHTLPATTEPPVAVERDGTITYLHAGELLATVESGADEVLVTLAVPVSALRALRALLLHPQLAAILDAHAASAPPVA